MFVYMLCWEGEIEREKGWVRDGKRERGGEMETERERRELEGENIEHIPGILCLWHPAPSLGGVVWWRVDRRFVQIDRDK